MSAQSSPSVSLLVRYRSLGHIIAGVASMATSTPSSDLVLPSFGLSPMTHASLLVVMSIPL